MIEATKKAKKALDSIARDPAAWQVMLDILHARGVRDELVRWRLRRGLKQSDVAKLMGVTQPVVAELENVRYPDYQLSTWQRYARAVECKIDLGFFDNKPATEESANADRE